ncbi:MAG: hypothetical protein WB608_04010 [Terracidiphilus sp.]
MRQEVYRVAFDEAKAELAELLGRFEQLRQRKDRIEKVVEALKPIMGAEGQGATLDRAATIPERQATYAAPEPSQPASEPVAQAAQEGSGESNDPFQRRVDNAVGLGSGARDIREYSRLFNGGSSR